MFFKCRRNEYFFFASTGVNAVKHLKVPKYNETYCMPPTVRESFFIAPVTEHEVLECVQGLKTKKSYGFDGISTHTVKQIIHLILQPLTKIINKNFRVVFFLAYVILLRLFQFLSRVMTLNMLIIDLYQFYLPSLEFSIN